MKFTFHMPTYREQEFFGQSGWHPSRSTCNDLDKANKSGSATSYAWLYSGLDAPNESLPDLSIPLPDRPPPNFDDPLWQYAPYNIFHWSLFGVT